jgi:DNA-binding MarR family transcriptional regulator
MTPLLQRLEQAGLIVRRRSPLDSRAVLVELTSVGVELERSAATVQRTVECATGLSPHALAALRGELHELVNDMRATAAGPPPMEGQAS